MIPRMEVVKAIKICEFWEEQISMLSCAVIDEAKCEKRNIIEQQVFAYLYQQIIDLLENLQELRVGLEAKVLGGIDVNFVGEDELPI